MQAIRFQWIQLYENYTNSRYRRETDDRAFKAYAGVPIAVAESIFLDYQHPTYLPNRSVLLLVLHFLKVFPSEDNGTAEFKFGSRNTYRKYLWNAIFYLDSVMNEIALESRFDASLVDYSSIPIFNRVFMVVDGTQCPIRCPTSWNDTKRFRMEFHGHVKSSATSYYNINYTVGVSARTGKIVYVGGPHKGKSHDLRNVQNEGLIAIILKKNPYELVLSDTGYIGEPVFLTPHKRKPNQEVLSPKDLRENKVISSVRQIVECTLSRIKCFGVLGSKGKWKLQKNLRKHRAVFNVCCQITNIGFEGTLFGRI